ncbi:MAG: squalene--hopene cyclase [Gammaproteobacteria bacterium]|nr:squalene--hopene cyclase [Gammaproteobacteria bacterium]
MTDSATGSARPAALAVTPQQLSDAIDRAAAWLDDNQLEDGSWVGMLESNQCMEAEWLLVMHVVGRDNDPKKPGLIQTILDAQRDDGSWEVYYDAPTGDINATVECYAALRAHGIDANHAALCKAREWIFSNGGLSEVRVFTRYWLALIGEWPWENTPNLPPEVILLPDWAPITIYDMASWARGTVIPLAVLSARRAVYRLPPERRLDELFPDGRDQMDYTLPRKVGDVWELAFRGADRLLHVYQSLGGITSILPLREFAIRRCLDWVLERQEEDGAWGGIQPPWIYSVIALHHEGYALEHPVVKKGLDALDAHWTYEKNGSLRVQASESIVWDTLLALLALADCDRKLHDSPAMQRALEWVLNKQVTTGGDWQVKVKGVEPGGWPFERANNNYPDVDDTAVALMVLALLRDQYHDHARIDQAIERARNWVVAMQCSNGGWAAFDKDNDNELLTKLPFCDFGETLDPPSADVTGHVLEAFGMLGMTSDDPVVRCGYQFLVNEQEDDNSWFGRWGVNHLYGTAAVLPALHAVGQDMRQQWIRAAADWVAEHQNEDGGWGESCASYMDRSMRGRGDSTASQTAWALMALLAMGEPAYRVAIERGLAWLIAKQDDNGTWDEPQYTGTGFPGYGIGARMDLAETNLERRLSQGTELARGFMINYNLYRHYFPLIAMGRARRYLHSGHG